MNPAPAKQAYDGINVYKISAKSTRKFAFYDDLYSIVTSNHCFCLNIYHFNPNAPFQDSSLHFKHSSVALTNTKSKTYSSSSGHSNLISLDKASSTIINKKGLNTEP